MASLDDILTVQKNGVVAINGLVAATKLIEADLASIVTQITIIAGDAGNTYPSTISNTVAASTTELEYVGSGKLFSVSIPVHGGAFHVYIYDSATTGGIAATNLIYKSLASNAASFQAYQSVQLPFVNGLVLQTDAGMNFCVGYTPDA